MQMIHPAVHAEVMLIKYDEEADGKLEDFRHDDGRCRHEHVAAPCAHVAHDENEKCILGR